MRVLEKPMEIKTRGAAIVDDGAFLVGPGRQVERNGVRGVVTHVVNTRWADVRWSRPDGSHATLRSYLPDCSRVVLVLGRAA